MSRNRNTERYTVTEGEGCVIVRRQYSDQPIIAKVLGEDCEQGTGSRRLWLDRRIHDSAGQDMGAWHATGAVSTILTQATERA